jgi:hypothetical protein
VQKPSGLIKSGGKHDHFLREATLKAKKNYDLLKYCFEIFVPKWETQKLTGINLKLL